MAVATFKGCSESIVIKDSMAFSGQRPPWASGPEWSRDESSHFIKDDKEVAGDVLDIEVDQVSLLRENSHQLSTIAAKFKVANDNIKHFSEPKQPAVYCDVPKGHDESDKMFEHHIDN